MIARGTRPAPGAASLGPPSFRTHGKTHIHLYMRHSTPNRPGWNLHYFCFFYIQVCYKWPQKNYPRQFSDFFENFLAVMVGIVDLALRTVIDSFEIRNANSKKKLKLIYLRKVYRYIPSKKWDSFHISHWFNIIILKSYYKISEKNNC